MILSLKLKISKTKPATLSNKKEIKKLNETKPTKWSSKNVHRISMVEVALQNRMNFSLFIKQPTSSNTLSSSVFKLDIAHAKALQSLLQSVNFMNCTAGCTWLCLMAASRQFELYSTIVQLSLWKVLAENWFVLRISMASSVLQSFRVCQISKYALYLFFYIHYSDCGNNQIAQKETTALDFGQRADRSISKILSDRRTRRVHWANWNFQLSECSWWGNTIAKERLDSHKRCLP